MNMKFNKQLTGPVMHRIVQRKLHLHSIEFFDKPNTCIQAIHRFNETCVLIEHEVVLRKKSSDLMMDISRKNNDIHEWDRPLL